MLNCNESEERVKAEIACKQFDFMTAGLFEGFVWDLNERCHFCACLCGVRMTCTEGSVVM